jgi:tubulin epsilon
MMLRGCADALRAPLVLRVVCIGPLNVDLNEITMNLVPFPRMHFLLSSMAPLIPPVDVAAAGSGRGGGGPVPSRTADALFADAFSREAQLLRADPRRSTYLAAALLLRGPVTLSDIHRNAGRLSSSLRMAPWNTEGFKIGLCATPPPGVPASLFVLSNSSCVGATLGGISARYGRLRARSFYLHHYAEYMEVADMDAAAEQVTALAAEYGALEGPDGGAATAPPPERLAPLGVGLGAPRR